MLRVDHRRVLGVLLAGMPAAESTQQAHEQQQPNKSNARGVVCTRNVQVGGTHSCVCSLT